MGTFGQGRGHGQGRALLGPHDEIDGAGALGPSGAPGGGPDVAGTLRTAVRRLVSAMVGLQRDDGHWYAVVDDPRSGDEHSTAAFLAADGTLAEVSAAVMAFTEPSHHAHMPRGFRVPRGKGPALLAPA